MNERINKFDAFISYSHKDKQTIEWLQELLSGYWVPGFKKRKIFVDKQSLKGDHGLNHSIKEALDNSRYLIVCCSNHAKSSDWVDKEVEHFLTSHPANKVIACVVGDSHQEVDIPNSILALEQDLDDVLLKPKLKTNSLTKTNKPTNKYDKLEALTLLATILELPDKNAILDKRKKRQIFRILGVSITTLLILISFLSYQWWLKTPEGSRHQVLNSILATAATDRTDIPDYMLTAEVIARKEGKTKLEAFSRIYDQYLSKPILLAGYASLEQPDCAEIDKLIAQIEDPYYIKNWPRGLLKSIRVCPNINWEDFFSDKNQSSPSNWAMDLARTSFDQRVQNIVAQDSFPLSEVFPIGIQLFIQSNNKSLLKNQVFNNWLQGKSQRDRLYNITQQLELLELHGRLDSEIGHTLSERAFDLSLNLQDSSQYVYSWELVQRTAAHLALLREKEKASTLLDIGSKQLTYFELDPMLAPGWAWRAVALKRMDKISTSKEAISAAYACSNKQIPASRTWGEWEDIMKCHILMDEWETAFWSTDQPKRDVTCFDLKCKAIYWWEVRR